MRPRSRPQRWRRCGRGGPICHPEAAEAPARSAANLADVSISPPRSLRPGSAPSPGAAAAGGDRRLQRQLRRSLRRRPPGQAEAHRPDSRHEGPNERSSRRSQIVQGRQGDDHACTCVGLSGGFRRVAASTRSATTVTLRRSTWRPRDSSLHGPVRRASPVPPRPSTGDDEVRRASDSAALAACAVVPCAAGARRTRCSPVVAPSIRAVRSGESEPAETAIASAQCPPGGTNPASWSLDHRRSVRGHASRRRRLDAVLAAGPCRSRTSNSSGSWDAAATRGPPVSPLPTARFWTPASPPEVSSLCTPRQLRSGTTPRSSPI